MKCTVCNSEYEAKRSDSKYCSPTCRKKASRDVTDNELSVTKADVTDNFVTDNQPKNVTDNCHSVKGDKYCSCGARIHPVLHPSGPHEVILDMSTRHLFSYWSDYKSVNQPDVSVIDKIVSKPSDLAFSKADQVR